MRNNGNFSLVTETSLFDRTQNPAICSMVNSININKKNQRSFLFVVVLLFIICCYAISWFWDAFQISLFTSSTSAIPGIAGGAGFVTRSNTALQLGGQPFRFSGANIYWLGLEQLDSGSIVYPSHFQVDDALATASSMGATVIRAHTLGISVGCSLCIEPDLGQFNQTAFDHIDYALQSARTHHLKVIIPLVDNWHYYHGGKHTFTEWRGLSQENEFYTDSLVIQDFEDYIQTILNHVNTYTGIAYKNDPTILAWETGNELSAPASWVRTISAYIKGIDVHHLVMDGNYEQANTFSNFSQDLAITTVDIYTGHYYPPTITALQTELVQVEHAHKVFIVGEYDWNTSQGDNLQSFLSAIQNSSVAGDLYWALFSHNDSHGFVLHNEHFTLHYPGYTSATRQRTRLLVVHAYAMQDRAIPFAPPGTPLLISVNEGLISWRGAFGSDTYSIERSTHGAQGPWTVICQQCVTDYFPPWKDISRPSGTVTYRIRAYSVQEVPGPYSTPLTLN